MSDHNKHTLTVGEETKTLLLHGVKRHLEVDFPLLQERVNKLECAEAQIVAVETKVLFLENKFSSVSDKVDRLENSVNDFKKEICNEFRLFTNTIRDINNNFIFWLVGTVLVSLILGLSTQYKAFHEVHESIFKLDKRIEANSTRQNEIRKQKKDE